MRQTRLGFTLVETVAAVLIVGLLLSVLMPMAGRTRNADGLQVSLLNMATIIQATQMYHFDHAGQVPLRGSRYNNGQLQGWDTWSVGGKNCSSFWQTSTGGIFDESAYSRFLNPYLYSGRIPKPTGYVNTGAGSTWTLFPGTPTAQQRANLQIPIFKSPGDTTTYQRVWPSPTPGVSGYNDIGTSYVSNMKWWDLPELASLSFTNRFNEGTRRIGLAFGGANPHFVFMHDQIADVVANASSSVFSIGGEFGKTNASVMGYADGRAAYMRVVPTATSGPGYTFVP